MQEFHDFALPILSSLRANLEDEFSARLDLEDSDRPSGEANFATVLDSIGEYREFVAGLKASKARFTPTPATRVRTHLKRITNSLERVMDRMHFSPDSREHLSSLVHEHHKRVNAHISQRLGGDKG